MAQGMVDSEILTGHENTIKTASLQILNSEMPNKEFHKEKKRVFKSLLNKLRCKQYACATISEPDPTYQVAYLGNVVTGWAKGEGCVEKPLATLWRNYTQSSRPDVRMQLTVSAEGLKARTKDHGLTEYWAHRLTTCAAPTQYPRLFCWVYRHEGKRLKHELRCHAVLCCSTIVAKKIETELKQSLAMALLEFKRDKISRQNARLSLANSLYEYPTIPRRKILLSTGSHNYKPPLERSKSAPKLTSIEEIIEEEDIFQSSHKIYKDILKHYDSSLLGKRKNLLNNVQYWGITMPVEHNFYRENDMLTNVEDLTLDEKSDMILDELVQNSFRNDLLESCERAWYDVLQQKSELIVEDETSLSSSCESSTAVSLDLEQGIFPTVSNRIIHDRHDESNKVISEKKTDLDFIVDNLSRVRSFEKMASADIFKYCGLNPMPHNKTILNQDEVSLIPVGESHSDFSSLKVYKKRSMSEPNNFLRNESDFEREENDGACSDESGFDEDEQAISVGTIVLV